MVLAGFAMWIDLENYLYIHGDTIGDVTNNTQSTMWGYTGDLRILMGM
jgi:hypothetical protein